MNDIQNSLYLPIILLLFENLFTNDLMLIEWIKCVALNSKIMLGKTEKLYYFLKSNCIEALFLK